MQKTIEALRIYDGRAQAREDRLEAAQGTVQCMAAFEAGDAEFREVQRTFCAEYGHSLDHAPFFREEHIRVVATGHPGVASVGIGATMFGKLTGEFRSDGKPEWRLTPHMGSERVNLLRTVRDGGQLPDGLILVGDLGGFFVIPPDAVRWDEMRSVCVRPTTRLTRRGARI